MEGGVRTDYYKVYGENLYYYDVNSLYPFAMLNDMPLDIIKRYTQEETKHIKLAEFFGFLKVRVNSTPNSKLINPMLPVKYNDKTIFPYGSWTGTYFSEELKAMIPLGYQFEILEAIEFSRVKLFNEFIDYFYIIKKTATRKC